MYCKLVLKLILLQMQKVKMLVSSKLCSDSHWHRLSPVGPLLTETSGLSWVFYLLQISRISDSPYAEKILGCSSSAQQWVIPRQTAFPHCASHYVYNYCTDTYTIQCTQQVLWSSGKRQVPSLCQSGSSKTKKRAIWISCLKWNMHTDLMENSSRIWRDPQIQQS